MVSLSSGASGRVVLSFRQDQQAKPREKVVEAVVPTACLQVLDTKASTTPAPRAVQQQANADCSRRNPLSL